ncbi:MAG: T9SS type A sorting domain-containing protein [Rhodothermales bacterium]
MRSRWILLAASLAFSLPAWAQPADHPFFPLAEGNVWIHDVYGLSGGHRTTTVLGWEGEGDEAFWRVGVSFARFDGGAPTESECAVRIVESGGNHSVEVTLLSGTSCFALEVEPLLPASGTPGAVWVTGQPHTLTLQSISASSPQGPPIHCMRVAENVGVFSRSSCSALFGGGRNLTERLVYAVVDGTTYGTHPDDFFASHDPMQYMPLDVGNRWIYEVSRYDTGLPSSSYLNEYLITGFNETTGRYALTLTRSDEGEVTATYSCQIWMDPAGRIRFSGSSACVLGTSPLPESKWSFRLIGASALQSYDISGIPYDLLTLSFSESMPRYNAYDNQVSTTYQSAHGLGLLHYDYDYYNLNANYGTGRTYTLLFADTGEAVYGVNPVASEDTPVTPDRRLRLSGHPNPFSGSAEIAFHLPSPGTARLAVYDMLGREVAVLADGRFDAGDHAVQLDGTELPSGVYLVRIEGEAGAGAVATRRVTLIR